MRAGWRLGSVPGASEAVAVAVGQRERAKGCWYTTYSSNKRMA